MLLVLKHQQNTLYQSYSKNSEANLSHRALMVWNIFSYFNNNLTNLSYYIKVIYQKNAYSLLSVCLLFSTFVFSQLTEASHLFEEDCHEQNCFICPNGGDDKFIASSAQEEEANFESFLSFSFVNQFSHCSTKLNTPIRAPPFLRISTSHA